MAKKLFLMILLFVLYGCSKNAEYKYDENQLTYTIVNAYNENNLEKSRELINSSNLYNNAYISNIKLHFLIRDGLETGNFDWNMIDSYISDIESDSDHRSNLFRDVQLYKEYAAFTRGDARFIAGACPTYPIKDACDCRSSSIVEDFNSQSALSRYFYIERLAWFSSHIREVCKTTKLDGILISATADGDANKGASLYTEILNSRTEDGKKDLIEDLCRIKNLYINFPENSGVQKIENLGKIKCI